MNIVYVVGDSVNTHNARTQITYAAWMKWNGATAKKVEVKKASARTRTPRLSHGYRPAFTCVSPCMAACGTAMRA